MNTTTPRTATLAIAPIALLLAAAMASCGSEDGSAAADVGGDQDTASQLSDTAATDAASADAGADDVGKADAGKSDSGAADSAPTDTADTAAADTAAADAGASDGATTDTSVGPGDKTTWFSTCGDPVCSGWKSKPNVPLCTVEKKGDPCGAQGAQCDPKDGCNATLICAEKDPKQGPGGCPISARRFKTGISYLDHAQEAALRDQLLHLPLATWRYKQGTGARRLGYILDDAPALPATDLKRERVDVYSLATMAVAAVKAQQRELRDLREELARVRAACQPGH